MDEDAQKDSLSGRIKEKFEDGIRPGFLGGEGGGEAPSGSKAERKASERAAANGAAADSLKNAEGNASGGLYHRGDSLTGAKEDEDNPNGLYKQASKAAAASKEIKKGNFKGAFKKGGPIIGIFLVIFGIGGIMAGTQVFEPFSLSAQFQESYNSMHISAEARSARFYKSQMDSGRYKKPLTNSIFGKNLKISDKQAEELKKQGIEYDEDYNGQRVLKYTDTKGELKIVTADNFKDVYASDTDFFHRYNSGSMTWRGQFANWFGNTTNTFIKNNKLTRNMWKDYKKKAQEADSSGKTRLEMVKEELHKRTDTIEDGGIKRLSNDEAVDDEGNVDESKIQSDEASSSKINRQKIDVEAKLDSIKAKMQGGANAACAVLDTIGAISALVAASEALQIINLTTSYMETVDKTKAGYGDEAPINELTNALNEKVQNTNVTIESTEPGAGISVEGETVDITTSDPIVTEKTAMQAAGMAALYGDGLVGLDASAQSFNLTSSMNRIMGGIGTSMTAFEGCLIAKITTATASMIMDGVGILGCALTFWAGGGMCWGLVAKLGLGIVASVSVAALLGAVISAITPWAVNVLTRDLVEDLGGEDLGNALVSGANMYQGDIHKVNGGSLATKDEYEDFAIEQQRVIAEAAKEERENLSPFDITSKNTFMGSLMTQFMSFMTTNSLMSTITTSSSVISSSIMALTPTTSAVTPSLIRLPKMEDYEKTCPYLASIGAIGDSYCNPYMITDMSTMDMDPDDVIQTVDDLGGLSNIQDEGNVTIDKDSRLAKYINYCGNRTSPFGIPDQSIVSSVQGLSSGNSTIDNVLGAVPILGDAVDIAQNVNSANSIGYISGQSCVAGAEDNSGPNSPNWDEAKYYQRFIEDQSLAESMGLIEKSAVSVYLEEYYEENPLDNSYEGMLARYSGLDKETVSDVLDVLAYYEYVNEYNPSERYAFGAPVVDEGERVVMFDNEDVMGGEAVTLENIVYADVRNRNFAV